jgi:Arc-like DNA binding domain
MEGEGMPNTRSRDAVIQLKARMHEPLRARLEKLAKQRGVSLNTELVDRIKESFAKEDSVGGPEVAAIVRLITAAFILGGQRAAHRKHPKWKIADWINDPACYEAAVAAVLDALHAMQPPHREPWDKATNQRESWESRVRQATLSDYVSRK